jgi:prephenate dehydratase
MSTVAYPGPEGSHTAVAAASLFPRQPLLPVGGFRAVADAVVAADAAFGVLPIESSLAGAVAETHDLLYDRKLSIVEETILPVTHCLAAVPTARLEGIRTVHSHPAALEQCRHLLASLDVRHLVPSATTAEAAKYVAEAADSTLAAVASPVAAELYGLSVLVADAGDLRTFTRFVSIAPFTCLARSDDARTALTFVTDHRPGALYSAIEPFARAGLDLVRLVSRPLPATPWRYRFDAVLAGHPLDPVVRRALRDLRDQAASLRIIGVYDGHPGEAA